MRFCNQVKIKGQECLEASITHNFTLCCHQKSVLGTILNAIHWCLWFSFAVPGSRIACKISSCSSIAGKRAKSRKSRILILFLDAYDWHKSSSTTPPSKCPLLPGDHSVFTSCIEFILLSVYSPYPDLQRSLSLKPFYLLNAKCPLLSIILVVILWA